MGGEVQSSSDEEWRDRAIRLTDGRQEPGSENQSCSLMAVETDMGIEAN